MDLCTCMHHPPPPTSRGGGEESFPSVGYRELRLTQHYLVAGFVHQLNFLLALAQVCLRRQLDSGEVDTLDGVLVATRLALPR